jgi:hypothetical protein
MALRIRSNDFPNLAFEDFSEACSEVFQICLSESFSNRFRKRCETRFESSVPESHNNRAGHVLRNYEEENSIDRNFSTEFQRTMERRVFESIFDKLRREFIGKFRKEFLEIESFRKRSCGAFEFHLVRTSWGLLRRLPHLVRTWINQVQPGWGYNQDLTRFQPG